MSTKYFHGNGTLHILLFVAQRFTNGLILIEEHLWCTVWLLELTMVYQKSALTPAVHYLGGGKQSIIWNLNFSMWSWEGRNIISNHLYSEFFMWESKQMYYLRSQLFQMRGCKQKELLTDNFWVDTFIYPSPRWEWNFSWRTLNLIWIL